MSDINILIATPAFGGQVCADYTESLVNTVSLFTSLGIKFTVKFINNQIVTRARNMLCHTFMTNESFTHMIFIDADLVWHPQQILALLSHDLECVIGCYPNKHYYWQNDKLILNNSSQVESPEIIVKEHLVKLKYAATGFMLLKKSALIKIQHDIQQFVLPSNTGIQMIYNYFDCNVVDNNYLTEDYYFSHLLNKNGGEVFADKRINLQHIGPHHYGELIK